MSTKRDFWNWGLGFLAGSDLASYLTLSCAVGHSQSVPELIDAYAARYGVHPGLSHKVAWCESRYLNVPNRRGSGAAGIYQFMPATWRAKSWQAGWGGASVWEVEANVATALFVMGVQRELGHWAACL